MNFVSTKDRCLLYMCVCVCVCTHVSYFFCFVVIICPIQLYLCLCFLKLTEYALLPLTLDIFLDVEDSLM